MGQRRRAARRRTPATIAATVAAIAAAGTGAAGAQAADWGYEQVTPADGGTYVPLPEGVSADLSTVYFATFSAPVDGLPYDGRPVANYYGTYKTGGVWKAFWDSPLASEAAQNLIQIERNGWAADGSRSFLQTNERLMGEAAGPASFWHYSTPRDAYQDATSLTSAFAPDWPRDGKPYFTPDGSTVAVRSLSGKLMVLAGGTTVQANVDDDGNPMALTAFDGMLDANPISDDGAKVIFQSSTPLGGDNDGTGRDLYERDLGAGTTRLISDQTDDADPDPSVHATFAWASPDHGRVMWSTAEEHPGDTDTAVDLYYRDGDGPIVRITQGETVDGSPTGNTSGSAGVVDWVATSGDGNYVYFITGERLTEDAPADTSKKLYERDIAEGVTRFVAGPLSSRDTNASAIGSLLRKSFARTTDRRGVRGTSWGAVIQSAAPLAGDADGQTDVFAWTRDEGGLRLISTPEAGAPASGSTDAFLVAYSAMFVFGAQAETFDGGRSVGGAGDGRVFFTTGDSLTAQDTDGGRLDVYAWSTDGSLELISPPGDTQTDATYVENSPDGSRVFFTTDETLLPGDTDNGVDDIYLAILGGGSAPSKPVPPAPPAGPGAAAGPLPEVPSAPVPASGTPKPVEPVAADPPLDPVEPSDGGGDRLERAKLKARVAKRLGADGARLVTKASAAGELRIRAVARVSRGGELRRVRVADVDEEIAAGELTRFDVALSDAAMERLEERGRLRVRFVVRLRPSGEQRGAQERVTVTLRSGQRR